MNSHHELYRGKPGLIHTEYKQVANLLELYGKAERIGTKNVRLLKEEESEFLFNPDNLRTFYILKVDDLMHAYKIVRSAQMSIW